MKVIKQLSYCVLFFIVVILSLTAVFLLHLFLSAKESIEGIYAGIKNKNKN